MDVQALAFEAFRAGIFKKNIRFIFNPEIDLDEFVRIRMLAGTPGQTSWMIQQAYRKVGVQMQVTRQVSDDLMATDFSGAATVDTVPWPAPVVEFYFQDPLLPSMLLMKTHPDNIGKWFPGLDPSRLKPTEYLTALMHEDERDNRGGTMATVQLTPDMYNDFLLTGEGERMPMGLFTSELTDRDNCALAFMINLSLKVLAFASIPQYKPLPIARKQMTFGGKPGVCERPQRPAYRADYAPQVIRPKGPPTGASLEFRGRRGHIRFYKSEVFTHRKGTWDFLQPVIDPVTGKYPERKVIRVRKPSQ